MKEKRKNKIQASFLINLVFSQWKGANTLQRRKRQIRRIALKSKWKETWKAEKELWNQLQMAKQLTLLTCEKGQGLKISFMWLFYFPSAMLLQWSGHVSWLYFIFFLYFFNGIKKDLLLCSWLLLKINEAFLMTCNFFIRMKQNK